MPTTDKIIWFVVGPVLMFVLAFLFEGVTDDPINAALLPIWFLFAIGSWVMRRPYERWARIFRWFVVVGLIAVAAQNAQTIQ